MVGHRLVWWDAGSARRTGRLAAAIAALLVIGYFVMLRMPGQRYRGELPELSAGQQRLAAELRADVDALAVGIGERSIFDIKTLRATEAYLAKQLREAGYTVQFDGYEVLGETVNNLIVTIPGGSDPDHIIVLGAHYDTADGTPGANDNASGVAGVLALARRFADAQPARTIRFVCFVNEEPPFFSKPEQGSSVYAERCRAAGEQIEAMVLECIGCYDDRPDSQDYPLPPLRWLFGDRGNFIGFVGNVSSRRLVHDMIGTFRAEVPFPSEGLAAPPWVKGIGWSDHASFWKAGYQAVMVSDTALFRYDHYHQQTDLPEVMDFATMARVVDGLAPVLAEMAGCRAPTLPCHPFTPQTPSPTTGEGESGRPM